MNYIAHAGSNGSDKKEPICWGETGVFEEMLEERRVI